MSEYDDDDDFVEDIHLSGPQSDFYLCDEPYPLFVAGYGSGKSTCLAVKVLDDCKLPKAKIGVYAPTYDLLSLIIRPYLEEFMIENDIPYQLNKSDNIFYLGDRNQIIMRSLDNPARIVGYETLRAHIDELDTLPIQKARDAWNKVVARNRQKITDPETDALVKNGVRAYTTPEGFQFCYERWVKNQAKGYVRFHAPTYSNPHLPPDYIDNLRATYGDTPLIEAYIEGQFVNLTSGSVYYYDRDDHDTKRVYDGREPIHIGMDFNVNNMNAVIFVHDQDDEVQNGLVSSAVDEITAARDTPQVCEIIRERYPDSMIMVYPDASGKNTSSKSASESDLTILKEAGFNIRAFNKNPMIKNRIIAVNSGLATGKVRVNTNKCPELATALEQQVYDKNGQPEKHQDDNVDDINDAFGYYIFKTHPVIRRGAHELKLGGM